MSWRTAFTNLAAISVDGVTASYDLDELPTQPHLADLPALLPAFPAGGGALNEREDGFAALTLAGGVWAATLIVDHLLLGRPCAAGGGMSEALPSLVTLIDAYLSAVGTDPTLNGSLAAPLIILRITPGVIDQGGTLYHGVTFRQRWTRTISVEGS